MSMFVRRCILTCLRLKVTEGCIQDRRYNQNNISSKYEMSHLKYNLSFTIGNLTLYIYCKSNVVDTALEGVNLQLQARNVYTFISRKGCTLVQRGFCKNTCLIFLEIFWTPGEMTRCE